MRRWKHKRKGVQPKGRKQENRREQESWEGKDEQDFTFTFGHKLHDRGVLQLPHRRMNYSVMFQCLFYSSTASNYLHSCKEQLSTHIYGCVFCVRSWCFAVKCTSVCLTKGLQYGQKFGSCTLKVCHETFSWSPWPCMLERKREKVCLSHYRIIKTWVQQGNKRCIKYWIERLASPYIWAVSKAAKL